MLSLVPFGRAGYQNLKRKTTMDDCHEDTKQYKRNLHRLQSGEYEMKAKTQSSHEKQSPNDRLRQLGE